jgi:hypothetical protein
LNELYEKFKDRGLLVIGVSDEPENLIEDIFMQKVGVKYPFVRSTGINDRYGIKFFPSVYCVSPEGEVLTVPDDHMPAEDFLEQQLAKVSLVPKMPADSRFDVLRQGWEKHDYKKLADYLDKMLAQENLDAELRTAYEAQKAELQKRGERQTARIAELGKGPDFGSAETVLTKIAKEWKGLPPGDQAAQEIARFGKDAAISRELAASKALAKLVEKADTNKSSEKKKLADDLQKFCKKYAGTFACTRADELRSALLMTKGG